MPFDKPLTGTIPQREKAILEFWEDNKIFEKSVEQSSIYPRWVFYEGPPTANGRPHPGHVLTRVIKDLFPRYKTMTGHFVERKAGWDCHGLPVEIEVEKELGLNSKQEIEEYGVENFIEQCKKSVWKYLADWENITRLIAFWIDLENPYITYKNEYIESLWWIFKQIHRAELLVKGHKVVPFCNRCGTPLSSHEVAQGYEDVTEPSIYVAFQTQDNPDTYFLAWTTTPWTLLSNLALALGPNYEYIVYRHSDGKKYILAKALARMTFGDKFDESKIIESHDGSHFEGWRYKPLYPHQQSLANNYRVIMADFVSLEDGTGIVHIAPGYGEDDYLAGKTSGLDVLQVAKEDGYIADDASEIVRGKYFKDADKPILKDLGERGLLLRTQDYTHAYPHCWRCKSPLMYFARSSWFLTTTSIKDILLEGNEKIDWYPPTIKTGRFGKFLENNVDWAISRNRYWGTPLPIWVCEKTDCGHFDVLGSIAELKERANEKVPDDVELHRPGIDTYTLKCPKCGGLMRRVPEVADTWFDSGSMPVAQWHYPFEFKEHFKDWYPCDFISEAQDQTRGWFYTLHAVAGLLHAAAKKFPDDADLAPFRDWELSYRRCICLGLILDDEGLKMSKSKGGFVEPEDILKDQGADALRWHFFSNVDPWVSIRFTPESVREAQRIFLLTLRNVYQFFTIYADIDGYDPVRIKPDEESFSRLDRWILARLNRTIKEVRYALDNYDVLRSAKSLELFVDELSNWYVRRSRERFWRSEKDADKWAAYTTLYTVLVELSKLLAPFTPFVADEIYRNLAFGHLPDAKESVHLEKYPECDEKMLDDELEAEVSLAMEIAGLGRAARKAEKIRVRQPLSEVIIVTRDETDRARASRQEKVILDELNIKSMRFAEDQAEFVAFKVTPDYSKLGPRLGPKMPSVKKAFENADHRALRDSIVGGGTCTININGESLTFTDDEVQVTMESRHGYAAATGSRIVVVLKTELTPELEAEGIAREIVHHLQGLRKTADLDYQTRINAFVHAGDDFVLKAVEKHLDYVKTETLTDALTVSKDDFEADFSTDAKVNGVAVKLGIGVK
ncbi:MAG TPA: isoleucine--tRNA ligase [Firmicutes bacterium]|nr:isoleucine--tRNA ligase [Bacillota bacterium]